MIIRIHQEFGTMPQVSLTFPNTLTRPDALLNYLLWTMHMMWSVRKKASYTTKTLEWFGDLRKATSQEFVNSWAMRWIWTHLLGTMWIFYQIRTIYCNDFFSIIITMKKYGMEPLTIAAKLSISVTSVILEYVSVIRDWTMTSLNPPRCKGLFW